MAVVASRIRRRLQAHANAHASTRHNKKSSIRAVGTSVQCLMILEANRHAVFASGLWMRAEDQMDTCSRPPGCGAGPLGHWGGRAVARLQEDPSMSV